MKNLSPFLEELEFLEITYCVIRRLVVLPKTFKRLKTLALDTSLFGKVMQNKYPQLEKLSLSGEYEVDHDDFCSFILRHSKLKMLSFEDCSISRNTIKLIGKTLTQLEHFELKVYSGSYQPIISQAMTPFGSIKTLEKLILDCNILAVGNLFEAFAANKIGIEHLHLIDVNLSEKTQMHLKRLKTIRTLFFEMYDLHGNTERYFSVAENLPLLNVFHLVCRQPVSGVSLNSLLFKASELWLLQIETWQFTINVREYSKMLDIIKNRRKAISLEIRLCKGSGQIYVPSDKMKESEKWILFVEI